MSDVEFEKALGDSRRIVMGYCFTRFRNREWAEDATQGVLLKAWTHRGSFNGSVKISTWLLTIARNHCTDLFRRHYRRPQCASIESMVETANRNGDRFGPERYVGVTELDPERLAIGKQEEGVVQSALNNVSPRQRRVFNLRYSGMTYVEIADYMGIPLGTMKQCLHRTRAILAAAVLKSRKPPRALSP